jgi:periplasmic mercuric ion binding protein
VKNWPVTKMLVSMIAFGALASPALAGETTVTLAVRNWYCAACPHVIKQSLAAVPGVVNVAVSDKTKTASVTFDDTKTDVKKPRPGDGRGRLSFLTFIRKECCGHEGPRARYLWSCGGRVACCGAPVRPGRDRLCRLTKAARGQGPLVAIN